MWTGHAGQAKGYLVVRLVTGVTERHIVSSILTSCHCIPDECHCIPDIRGMWPVLFSSGMTWPFFRSVLFLTECDVDIYRTLDHVDHIDASRRYSRGQWSAINSPVEWLSLSVSSFPDRAIR